MYNCVVWDMDGTLIDSYEGIFHAYAYALEKMGMGFAGDILVRRAIGAPLLYAFEHLVGIDRDRALRAAVYYREYYAAKGKREVTVYPGIPETLDRLKQAGCFLGTATLKKEAFAREILEQTGLLPHLDAVCGMDEHDRLTKADLIRRCMQQAGADPAKTVLVGDSEFDRAGAREAGIDFLAVTYGFGFADQDSLQGMAPERIAHTPADIADRLIPYPASLS